jgi:hypothetical protein
MGSRNDPALVGLEAELPSASAMSAVVTDPHSARYRRLCV